MLPVARPMTALGLVRMRFAMMRAATSVVSALVGWMMISMKLAELAGEFLVDVVLETLDGGADEGGDVEGGVCDEGCEVDAEDDLGGLV